MGLSRRIVEFVKGSKSTPMGAIHIHCRVKPGVSKDRHGVIFINTDAVELNVAAPPRDGAANKAVIRVMSEVLKIPKSDLHIISGLKSRYKTIKICPSILGFSQNDHTEDWAATVEDRLKKHLAVNQPPSASSDDDDNLKDAATRRS